MVKPRAAALQFKYVIRHGSFMHLVLQAERNIRDCGRQKRLQ